MSWSNALYCDFAQKTNKAFSDLNLGNEPFYEFKILIFEHKNNPDFNL